MKDFWKQNGLWILFAAAVMSVTLAVLSYFSTNTSPLTDLVNTAVSPLRSGYAAAAAWLRDKQDYYLDNRALREDNEALRRQIAQMSQQVRQAEAALEENAFLRELLQLRAQRRDLSDFETATVTERSVTNWTASLTLDKGTAQGVSPGNCVIDGAGNLVGRISQAGVNWSTVLTVVDTDTSLGARVYRTGDIAIASGDFALMGEGKLKLDALPAQSALMEGDLVVTSGLGGFLPPDLVIGSVSALLPQDADTSLYALISPAANLDALTEVCIIRSFEIVS